MIEAETAQQSVEELREKLEPGNVIAGNGPDPWRHRSQGMRCGTCMWFAKKARARPLNHPHEPVIGRCRRRAPTMNGYPVVFENDWCGDHKLNENAA